MKKIKKILLIIVVVIVVLVVALLSFLIWASKQPAVKSDYYKKVLSDEPLEQKYIAKGLYEVSYIEYNADDKKIGQYKIWYPSIMPNGVERYPLVVMANGTGVPASKYEAIFNHLASWGFIVIGNEDESSWDGFSSKESLDFMLDLNDDSKSIFYNKLDVDHIGIAGHSQGGVGVINAVTNQPNGNKYSAMYTASITQIDLAVALEWSYDVKNVTIPYFFVAGTGKVDSETICPLAAMNNMFCDIKSEKLTVMARRKNSDHSEMLANADGYMTAWFSYLLKDDAEAKKIFVGENAEILHNQNWQDVNIKKPSCL